VKIDAEAEVLPEHLQALYKRCAAGRILEQRTRMRELLLRHADVFAKSRTDIGHTTLIEHVIDTGTNKPFYQGRRVLAPEEQKGMVNCMEEMKQMGLVRPSRSPWAANVRMVQKKSGEWRLCVDYRDVNKRTVNPDPYLLPKIDCTLDALGGSSYFCSLDLLWGYFQVPLAESSIPKTAFYTPRMSPSHWEFRRMPFGLQGAPATFQRMVDRVLEGIEYHIALAYLDDVIVYGRTFEECASRLELVLERVHQAGLKLKPIKCDLFKRSLEFLGHVVTSEGITTDPKKTAAVNNARIPLTVTDVKSFLGMCSYYRKFIKNFASYEAPHGSYPQR
jgi:hypothetical protein